MHAYDTWKTTDPFECYSPMEDYVHVDEMKKYEDAQEWVEEIIECVYQKGDLESLENALEELAHIYGVKFASSSPVIEKKSQKLFAWTAALTRAYAKVEECERLILEEKLFGEV